MTALEIAQKELLRFRKELKTMKENQEKTFAHNTDSENTLLEEMMIHHSNMVNVLSTIVEKLKK